MKMKKIAILIAVCFFATFVASPAYAWNDDRGPTERWGYGGKWENENSSRGDLAKWVVLGTLGLATLWFVVRPLIKRQEQPQPQQYQPSPPTYHPDKWPREIEPPTQQQQVPAWQQQPQPVPATYNVAEPF